MVDVGNDSEVSKKAGIHEGLTKGAQALRSAQCLHGIAYHRVTVQQWTPTANPHQQRGNAILRSVQRSALSYKLPAALADLARLLGKADLLYAVLFEKCVESV